MKNNFLFKVTLVLCLVLGCLAIFSVKTNASSVDEASDNLKEGLKNREKNIVIEYETTEEDHSAVIETIVNKALEHTGMSAEGDYIKYHLMSDLTGQIINEVYEDGKYLLKIKFSPRYLSSIEQEQELNNVLNTFYDSLNLDGMNDYDKLKSIYDYICDNVAYGYQNNSAYAALVNGSSSCRGYALLFYRMAVDLGFDARIISGRVVGGSYDNYHEWNIVRIGDKYYNVDVNFGDNVGGQAKYTYFLKGSEGIFKNGYGNYVPAHVRDEKFNNDVFNEEYPMSAADFDKNTITSAPEITKEPEQDEGNDNNESNNIFTKIPNYIIRAKIFIGRFLKF